MNKTDERIYPDHSVSFILLLESKGAEKLPHENFINPSKRESR